MKWERFRDPSDFYATVLRCAVPGGWLVRVLTGTTDAMTFYPDPEHTWDPNEEPEHAEVVEAPADQDHA